jgi:hypothetical protein
MDSTQLLNETITDQNTAFNCLVSFTYISQKRGVYTIEESSKLWDNIKVFDNEISTSDDKAKALQEIFQFVLLSQKKGGFSLPESHKINECFKFFQEKKV